MVVDLHSSGKANGLHGNSNDKSYNAFRLMMSWVRAGQVYLYIEWQQSTTDALLSASSAADIWSCNTGACLPVNMPLLHGSQVCTAVTASGSGIVPSAICLVSMLPTPSSPEGSSRLTQSLRCLLALCACSAPQVCSPMTSSQPCYPKLSSPRSLHVQRFSCCSCA